MRKFFLATLLLLSTPAWATDFLYKFPVSDLPQALTALAALDAAGLHPDNMLGDPRSASGAVVLDLKQAVWRGGQGQAAYTYTDLSGATVSVPAQGDPSYFYIAARADLDPTLLPFDLGAYGLVQTAPAESASVLGVWQ